MMREPGRPCQLYSPSQRLPSSESRSPRSASAVFA
jgi:hypothetical protein